MVSSSTNLVHYTTLVVVAALPRLLYTLCSTLCSLLLARSIQTRSSSRPGAPDRRHLSPHHPTTPGGGPRGPPGANLGGYRQHLSWLKNPFLFTRSLLCGYMDLNRKYQERKKVSEKPPIGVGVGVGDWEWE